MLQPLDDIRRQFEVNVIGLFAVTQAFLPLLGAQKNASRPPGRIINISPVGGKIAAPFVGAYVGSKHAVEGMSHSLRRELQLYGIDVILVGPGPVKTAIWDKPSATELGIFAGSDYAPAITTSKSFLSNQRRQAGYHPRFWVVDWWRSLKRNNRKHAIRWFRSGFRVGCCRESCRIASWIDS